MKVSQSCPTLCDPMSCSPSNSPGQNTGVGSVSLLQEIFPTQGSNPYCGWILYLLYQLSRKGNPRILKWVDYPFSCGSSRSRKWTGVSCTAGGFFTNWAIKDRGRRFISKCLIHHLWWCLILKCCCFFFFSAELDLCGFVWAFSSCGEWGLL